MIFFSMCRKPTAFRVVNLPDSVFCVSELICDVGIQADSLFTVLVDMIKKFIDKHSYRNGMDMCFYRVVNLLL